MTLLIALLLLELLDKLTIGNIVGVVILWFLHLSARS